VRDNANSVQGLIIRMGTFEDDIVDGIRSDIDVLKEDIKKIPVVLTDLIRMKISAR
jgi:hypothetical protein